MLHSIKTDHCFFPPRGSREESREGGYLPAVHRSRFHAPYQAQRDRSYVAFTRLSHNLCAQGTPASYLFIKALAIGYLLFR